MYQDYDASAMCQGHTLIYWYTEERCPGEQLTFPGQPVQQLPPTVVARSQRGLRLPTTIDYNRQQYIPVQRFYTNYQPKVPSKYLHTTLEIYFDDRI